MAALVRLTAWAAGEPRTEGTLNTLQHHLAQLGFLTEAVAVQREVIAVSDAPPEAAAFNLLTLGRLQRRAGDAASAWRTLEETRNVMPADKRGLRAGLWRHFVKECFLVVTHTPDDATARRRFAVSDEHLRGVPGLWMDGVLDAALAAAEQAGDPPALDRYRTLRQAADREREQNIG
ncbi:hypothetical protein ACFUEM_12825 [Streptomyces anulatus]|uniref:hypothetical protein n=1 Tax=Streptomyces anulatus TaxID=1892 RepID=UPI0035D54C4F